jgi:hypothetical protein
MRMTMVAVVLVWMGAGCGDDGATVTGDASSSETGTSADTTATSAETTTFDSTSPTSTTTTADTTDTGTSTTAGPTTDTTTDTSSSETVDPTTESSSESSSTGEPTQGFGPPVEVELDIDFEPLALVIDDFNGDGVLDLLVTGTSDSVVVGATFLGDGSGGFGAAIDAEIGGCSAFPITGAIDDDASADLFSGTCVDDPVFYLADGDGTFTSTEVLDPWLLAPVRSSRFVDHDVDGDDDLVIVTVGGGDAQLHLATQGDELTWPLTTVSAEVEDIAFDPDGLSIAQLDGEGAGDTLLLDVSSSLAFMIADGAGHQPAVPIDIDIEPTTLIATDLDDDGLDDVIVGSRTGTSVQVVRNDNLTFTADTPLNLVDIAPLDLAAGSWTMPGEIDIAVLDANAPAIVMLAADGADGFMPGDFLGLPSLAVRLLSADLDGDGREDLIAATFASGSVTVFLAE